MSDENEVRAVRLPSAGFGHIGIYTRELWFEFAFCLLFIPVGLALMVAPQIGEASPALEVMPELGLRLWGVDFLLGALLICRGVWTVKRDAEAAGAALLAVAFLATLCSTAFAVETPSPLGLGFYTGAFIACGGRSLFIAMRGC